MSETETKDGESVAEVVERTLNKMGVTQDQGMDQPDDSDSTRAVPEGQETPEGRDGVDVEVGEPRDNDKYLLSYRLINARWNKDAEKVREVQTRAAKMGHYGDELQREAKQGELRAPALTSTGNDAFLPTTVADEVQQISEDVGARARALQPCTTWIAARFARPSSQASST